MLASLYPGQLYKRAIRKYTVYACVLYELFDVSLVCNPYFEVMFATLV